MLKTRLLVAAAILSAPGPVLADTLFTNANGVQADAKGNVIRFDGLLVGDDGKVKKVLKRGEARPAATETVDLGGKVMMPGLIDAHGHIMGLGYAILQLNLTGTKSLEELKQKLRDHAVANPGDGWIIGRGWNQELWANKAFPTAADLDSVVADRPVWLGRVDGHAAVANSAALRAAGITPDTKAPEGGTIDSGLFVDAAMALVEAKIPAPGAAMDDRAFMAAQNAMLRYGLVGAADMGTSKSDWDALRRAGEAGHLKVRIMAYAGDVEHWRNIFGGQTTSWMYDDRLRLTGTKLYADGALGSRGAWLKAPYHDKPDTRGLSLIDTAALAAKVEEVTKGRGQLAIHAIGDAANAQVIGVFEAMAKKHGAARRWRIEHLQIADPRDLPRLNRAGIIASMQPTHQTSDRLMAEARLGPNRLGGAYAWNTIANMGVPLAFGSDFPVESPDPFPGLSAAISRQDVNGEPLGGWLPKERVSLGKALHGFTIGAAYAGNAEAKFGGLEAGKWADFIIVSNDPTKVGARDLAKTVVLETWIAGEREFSEADQHAN
jgi:predicted amidohydrolase YtcJ